MDPMLAGAIAAPVVGGVLGSISAASGRKAAAAAAAAALAQLNAIGMPPDLSKAIIIQQYQSQGVMTPELEQDINLQASQVAQIQEDQKLRNAQMESLGTLGQISRGGLQAGDRAAYNELRNQVARDEEAKRQQILQQMQARGQAGGGADLAAQLQASQAAADQASSQGDRLAAQASQNALNALNQRASLAGNVRGQDFSTAQAKAQALDQRNQFLFQNSVAQQQRNLAQLNTAQQANLANKQRLSEINTQAGNQELYRQNQAKRDYFQDQLNLASAKANALNNQGSILQQGANQQAGMYAGIGNAIGQGFGAYAANQQSNKQYDLMNGLMSRNSGYGQMNPNNDVSSAVYGSANFMGPVKPD